MEFLRRYGFYFLLAGVVSDFLTPYILGFFYPQLNQMTTVISVFGDVGSPVRKAFLIWSVVSGCFFVLALPAMYQTFVAASRPLALILAAAIGFYGVCDCIRIPGVNRLPLLNQLGFWQRLSFFFNYLPIGILSILQIKP